MVQKDGTKTGSIKRSGKIAWGRLAAVALALACWWGLTELFKLVF